MSSQLQSIYMEGFAGLKGFQTRLGNVMAAVLLPVLLAAVVPPLYAAEMVDGEMLVDPTAPLPLVRVGRPQEQAPSSGGGYRLSSILIRSDIRLAVINSQTVRVGDTVSGATVKAINTGSVTLGIGNQDRVVRIYEGSVKSPVTN